MINPFFGSDENAATEQFLRDGYFVFPIENRPALDSLRNRLYEFVTSTLGLRDAPPVDEFFNHFEKYVTKEQLNNVRTKAIAYLAGLHEVRPNIYSMAAKHLGWIVGNELAMQRACNLSIQLPQDNSSLLPMHSDVWSGNSPYEVVFWLPLVNCFKTKSMFILPRKLSDEVQADFSRYSKMSVEQFFESVRDRVVWLDVPYGHGLIFSHALMHGNRTNGESETRWTMNIRFKAALSPYGTKEAGESFLPITLRPITRFGYSYRKPECR